MVRRVVIFFLVFLKVSTAPGQVRSDTERNGLFLYTFAKYINWSVFVDQNAIIIGVADNEKVFRYMQATYHNRKIGERKVRVKKVSGIDAADCQILYVSHLHSPQSTSLLEYVRHLQVLVVTDAPSENPEIDIAILSKSEKPDDCYLKINSHNIRLKGLKISMELLGIAGETTWQTPPVFVQPYPLEYFLKQEPFTL